MTSVEIIETLTRLATPGLPAGLDRHELYLAARDALFRVTGGSVQS